MKVFVDANTIVSGLLFAGNEAVLLELGRLKALHLVTNEYVLREVREVLRRDDFHLTDEEQRHLVKYTLECTSIAEDPLKEDIEKHYDLIEDKKDLPIVVGAKKENCECLVTGDKELLSGRVKQFVNSITTSELLRRLVEEKSLRLSRRR